jgi:hypothetical protein
MRTVQIRKSQNYPDEDFQRTWQAASPGDNDIDKLRIIH